MAQRAALEYGTAVTPQRRRGHARTHGAQPRRGAGAHSQLSASDALDALETILKGEAFSAWRAREDDLATLRETRERLTRRETLAVVGEFSSGKSYLLNALLGKTRIGPTGEIVGLLATDINPSTATITELEYGTSELASATFASGRTERIPLDRLARFVAVSAGDDRGALHDATTDGDAAPIRVSVAVDSPFLRDGFVVADTPGLASPNPAHRRATLDYLPRADAVLYLIDTQQPFSEGDASFLAAIAEHVGTIAIVQTKIDLWRTPEADGRPAWQSARARIVARAASVAPAADVYAVSARDFAEAIVRDDAVLARDSGFPELRAGLDRSLATRVRRVRAARAERIVRELAASANVRIARAVALGAGDAATLGGERAQATAELAERERALGRARDDVTKAGVARRTWIAARGEALAADTARALARAIDVADIARIRDRGRFGALADAAVLPIWNAFARDVAADTARELERQGGDLRILDLAARRLGGEPGAGAWGRDLATGIAATIVLGALGGPNVAFAHAVARAFASRPYGTYMKREFGGDLTATLLPSFERDVTAFTSELATRVARIYDDAADALDRTRSAARDEALAPIDRAVDLLGRPAERRAFDDALHTAARELAAIVARVPSADSSDRVSASDGARAKPAPDAAFDAVAYDAGLRPKRYRIVVLGALRRGKSTVINALGARRILLDGGSREAFFPIHVRYGERDRAYALETPGNWREISLADAMTRAATSPVLVETPWSLPRQLVLVHAPAFDSGAPECETIALAAAARAHEVLALFSRQLSDSELTLYARVAADTPVTFVHTIADHETATERRTVVDLARRYLRERALDSRIFTIGALDALDAESTGRRPAAWNELPALRETLIARAEAHMARRTERERFAAVAAEREEAMAPKRPALARWFRKK